MRNRVWLRVEVQGLTIPPPLPLVTVFRTISEPDTAIPVAPPPWNESAPPSDSALLLLSVLAWVLVRGGGFRVEDLGLRV